MIKDFNALFLLITMQGKGETKEKVEEERDIFKEVVIDQLRNWDERFMSLDGVRARVDEG